MPSYRIESTLSGVGYDLTATDDAQASILLMDQASQTRMAWADGVWALWKDNRKVAQATVQFAPERGANVHCMYWKSRALKSTLPGCR